MPESPRPSSLMSMASGGLAALDGRSRDILRLIVDAYVETGEPVGSRTLSRKLGMTLSAATIRNVMADLEESGLLFSPHTSAGRLPTDAGLRLFVDGLLEVGDLSEGERSHIESQCASRNRSVQSVLDEASSLLSGLSACAGLVVAPKTDRALKHIEFVSLAPGRVLVILVTENGLVENRVIDVPLGLPASTLIQASNFLNARLIGRTLTDAASEIALEISARRTELDELAANLVAAGIAVPSGSEPGQLILKGQSRLLEDVTAIADLDRIRQLLDALETQEAMAKLLEAAGQADGVQIFIGSDNTLFSHAGCSLIIAPYRDGKAKIVGAIGVIGPTRLNYARIIPMVDYTAKVVGNLLWSPAQDKADE